MEQFVQGIVAGGLALVVGLWTVTLVEPRSGPWFAGVALGVAGVSGLAAHILVELDL